MTSNVFEQVEEDVRLGLEEYYVPEPPPFDALKEMLEEDMSKTPTSKHTRIEEEKMMGVVWTPINMQTFDFVHKDNLCIVM